MSAALSFRNISCRFNGQNVVDDVSFEIAPGEIICLLGPSGCGKTTSLRLAAGMETPDEGEIFLSDYCVSTPSHVTPPEDRGIGFLFQDFALFPHLSVRDNVTFGLLGMAAKEKENRAADLLRDVGLAEFADAFPSTLSGGEQQRAALARAMAPEPKLVLMDEPFSNLDPQLRDQMRDLTLRLLKQNEAAGLIVTHDAADALRMADRIAVQNKGRILQMDTPEVIYQSPDSLAVASMFGPVNLLSARAQNGEQQGVRPADITFQPTGDDIEMAATITGSRAVGREVLIDLTLDSGEIWQALVPLARRPSDDMNKFFVPQARLMLFKA